MHDRYRDRAAFLFVYIEEAHPADGWQMDPNEVEEVVFDQPTSWEERQSVAQKCCQRLDLSMPCVVDTIQNDVDNLYAGWPERLVVIDGGGRIAYIGAQGPWGFDPKAAEKALRRLLRSNR
jgi:type I thyroxine 5'-deiodinase